MGFIDYLMAAPFVIFFFGFCIFIHEFGHFLAAKWRGLHIVAFSIGFKKIWGFKYKGVDYRIGCIPCGGYVDLPQIDATGEPKDENGNPLPAVKPIDKMITAFAGPFFNVLFGVLLSVAVWHYGVPQGTPRMTSIKVATVDAFSPEYAAGLRKGDIITAFDGKSFNCTWNEFARRFIFAIKNVTLDVKRGDKKLKITYKPIPNLKRTPREKVPYPFFTPVIPLKCIVEPGSPVANAGMVTGDIVTAVNGKQIEHFSDFGNFLGKSDGTPFNLTVSRGGKLIELTGITPKKVKTGVYQIGVDMGESRISTISDVISPPNASESNVFKSGDVVLGVDGKVLGSPMTLGDEIEKAKGAPMSFLLLRDAKISTVSKVFPTPNETSDVSGRIALKYKLDGFIWFDRIMPGSPAAKAGLKAYDKVLSVNGKEKPNFKTFQKTVNASQGAPIKLVLERNGKKIEKTVTAKEKSILAIGVSLDWVNHPTPWAQFKQVIAMTYKSLRSIFKGQLGMKHLSGPLGIFRGIAVTYAKGGIMRALSLIVMITYSLAILNLMPLPVLDGGHIVLSLIQWGFGKPLSPKIVQPMFVAVIVLLFSMMLYVSFYDVLRYIPVTKEYRYSNPIVPVSDTTDKK